MKRVPSSKFSTVRMNINLKFHKSLSIVRSFIYFENHKTCVKPSRAAGIMKNLEDAFHGLHLNVVNKKIQERDYTMLDL